VQIAFEFLLLESVKVVCMKLKMLTNDPIQKIKVDALLVCKSMMFNFPCQDKEVALVVSSKLYDPDRTISRKALNILSEFSNRFPEQLNYVLTFIENTCVGMKLKNDNTMDQFVSKFDLIIKFFDDIKDYEKMECERLFKTLCMVIKACFDKFKSVSQSKDMQSREKDSLKRKRNPAASKSGSAYENLQYSELLK